MKYFDVAVPIDKFSYFTYRGDESSVKKGSVVKIPFRNKILTGVVIGKGKPFQGAKEIKEKLFDLPENLYKLCLWISDYYLCPAGIVFSFCLPPVMKRIKKPGNFEVDYNQLKLNRFQKNSIRKIKEYLDKEVFQSFLLFGVTGSGKTEIYLRIIEEVLNRGKSALYLTPEISTIPQVLERIRERFGQGEPYHYKLSKGDRYSYWMNALNGELKIGTGSRMSVFSPFKDPGLIIVDEEHSESYRQEDLKPRFSARDVALMRGKIGNFPVILGSATPSIESYHNVSKNKHILLELPERVGGLKMPEVEVVNPGKNIFSSSLKKGMSETLQSEDSSRIILFLNRRGYSPYAKCYNCGWIAKCPNCEISLTLHKTSESLVCHHCGYRKGMLYMCPKCGNKIYYTGCGTERIEEELNENFGEYNIKRMDADSTRKRHEHREIYKNLKEGKIEILLGTQMVTKGLDLPDIGLVGVISADTALNLPDFRATERTFQLLSQVAGRAGRGGKGKVIIQTGNPDHYVIQCAMSHDYRNFYNNEIEFRKSAKYPPFLNLTRVLLKSKKENKLREAAEKVKNRLMKILEEDSVRILGPTSCPIEKIRGEYRNHILIKHGKGCKIQDKLKNIYDIRYRDVKISFEIDPVNML